MGEQMKRMNIAELEKLIDQTADGEVEIKPDGRVIRLSPTELIQKNLRFEVQEIEVLRKQADQIRSVLKRVLKELDDLLP